MRSGSNSKQTLSSQNPMSISDIIYLMAFGLPCGPLCEARCCGGGGHCDSARGAPGCPLSPPPTKPPRESSILVYLQKFHSVGPRSGALRRVIYLSRLSGSCVGFERPPPPTKTSEIIFCQKIKTDRRHYTDLRGPILYEYSVSRYS